jgi:hypothetical protein
MVRPFDDFTTANFKGGCTVDHRTNGFGTFGFVVLVDDGKEDNLNGIRKCIEWLEKAITDVVGADVWHCEDMCALTPLTGAVVTPGPRVWFENVEVTVDTIDAHKVLFDCSEGHELSGARRAVRDGTCNYEWSACDTRNMPR